MTYRFGMKGAPAVGGGLGGLPGRALGGGEDQITQSYSGPRLTVPAGTYSLVATNTYVDSFTPGRMIHDDKFCFGYREVNGSTITFHYGLASIGPGGVTFLAKAASPTTDAALRHGNSWRHNNELYFIENNVLRKLSYNGVSLSITTVSSAFIPTSGTISGTSYTSHGEMYDSTQFTRGAVYSLGDGTFCCFRGLSTGGNPSPVGCFVFDGEGTLIASFIACRLQSYSTSTVASLIVLPKDLGTFSLVTVHADMSNNWWANSANVDAIARTATIYQGSNYFASGLASISSVVARSVTGVIEGHAVNSSGTAVEFTCKLDAAGNIAGAPTSFGNSIASVGANSPGKYWDSTFSDWFCYDNNYHYHYKFPLLSVIAGNGSLLCYTYKVSSTLNRAGGQTSCSAPIVKSVKVFETEASESAYGEHFTGPYPVFRISEHVFVCALFDKTTGSQRGYLQIFEAK